MSAYQVHLGSAARPPRITLVGAGPGDPELITIKGLKALRSADVVLYDALVSEALLEEAPASALKVYVGKRAGQHSLKQAAINLLMVQHALQHGHVVRLKGGDPFIFGRGHEELEYASSFNIPTEVIAGLSSCTALVTAQGVPLTRRGLNESFWVMTGTTRTGQLSDDVRRAAASAATVVILMGMGKLEEIAAIFAQHGKADTPVMVVQNGSLPTEAVLVSTVGAVVADVRRRQIGTPAVVVIGEVVGLHAAAVSDALVHPFFQTFIP